MNLLTEAKMLLAECDSDLDGMEKALDEELLALIDKIDQLNTKQLKLVQKIEAELDKDGAINYEKLEDLRFKYLEVLRASKEAEIEFHLAAVIKAEIEFDKLDLTEGVE